MMHIEIDRQADPARARRARRRAHPRAGRGAAGGRGLAGDAPRLPRRHRRSRRPAAAPNLAEYDDFLRWLEANHFTFLGHRRYRYVEDTSQPGGLRYELVPGSPLGILRRDEVRLFEAGVGGGEAMARFARGPQQHPDRQDRPRTRWSIAAGAMDCVIVKTYDADGRVTGEHRLVGLFTSAAYHAAWCTTCRCCAAASTTLLRRSGLDIHSHDGKALLAILEAYPRDELFQIDEDTLYDHVLGILQLQERRRVALFARRDAVGRFATCLVFAPRERFDATLSEQLRRPPRAGLARQGAHRSPSSVSSDSALAQVALHAEARLARARPRPISSSSSAHLADAATSWSDRLRTALQDKLGEVEGRAAARRWRDWFPAVYRDSFDAGQAVADLDLVQAARRRPPVRRAGSTARPACPLHRFTLRLFHPRRRRSRSPTSCRWPRISACACMSEAPFLLRKDGGDDRRAWRCRC